MSDFEVTAALPHELRPGLRILRGPESSDWVEQCHETLTGGQQDQSVLLVAREAGGRVCGAGYVQVMPGALGVIWPPRAESPEIEDALVQAVGVWLRDRNVKVCQAFVRHEERAAVVTLTRNGFHRVTQLAFLKREVHPDDDFPSSSLTFAPEFPPFTQEFHQTLLATHEGTLDCPEMNAARTSSELLEGFADEVPGTRWDLVKVDNVPVGVVVRCVGLDPPNGELSYLGVVPAARGRGLGGELLKFTLREARLAGAQTVLLTVDVRNEPALHFYRREGFVETDRRDVLLACWGG